MVIFLVLLYTLGPGIAFLGLLWLAFQLQEWWIKRPLSPRRRLKLQRKIVEKKIDEAMSDMGLAAQGTYIQRGPWWNNPGWWSDN